MNIKKIPKIDLKHILSPLFKKNDVNNYTKVFNILLENDDLNYSYGVYDKNDNLKDYICSYKDINKRQIIIENVLYNTIENYIQLIYNVLKNSFKEDCVFNIYTSDTEINIIKTMINVYFKKDIEILMNKKELKNNTKLNHIYFKIC